MLYKKNIYFIVVPDICCYKNPTACTCFFLVCSTPGPMSSPDTVSKFTVSQWDHKSSSMGWYHDHVLTASSQRDCVSQSTLSHYNLANPCERRSSSHNSPLSETRHVWGNCLLKDITILIHVRHHMSIFLCLTTYEMGKMMIVSQEKILCPYTTWLCPPDT